MLLTGILAISNVAISEPENKALTKYSWMKQLDGEWVLSPLCQSRQNHIHKITHTLSEGGNHLITSYTTFNDGAYMKDSVYHFDRK